MTALEAAPLINTRQLEHIYTTVTDSKLWKETDIIQTLSTLKKCKYYSADMIISD